MYFCAGITIISTNKETLHTPPNIARKEGSSGEGTGGKEGWKGGGRTVAGWSSNNRAYG